MTVRNDVHLVVGQVTQVTAVRLNDDGDGVCQVAGMTVFVPHLLPGETATATITELHRRFARASIVTRANEAEMRVQPVCAVHGDCGGCQLQHVQYAEQLAHKQAMVAHALRRLPQATPVEVRPTLGMAHPYRYRNQVQVPVAWDEAAQHLRYGFYAPTSHRIVETSVCHLEPEAMERTVVEVMRRLEPTRLVHYVHHVIVRRSHTNGEQMVILSVDHDYPAAGQAIETLLAGIPSVVSIAITIHQQYSSPVWGEETVVLAGAAHLRERFMEIDFLVSPRSFFQVNTEQAAQLCAEVARMAALSGAPTVLDAYCGAGTLSLPLARSIASTGGRVIGIDSVEPAIADARANATYNAIANASFEVGLVEDVLPKMVQRGQVFDVVVLDPPRKGCHPRVLEAVLQARPQRIVYVSCNHVTLGRDLQLLVAGGYVAQTAQPVDMFPQTGHVECVVATHYVGKK